MPSGGYSKAYKEEIPGVLSGLKSDVQPHHELGGGVGDRLCRKRRETVAGSPAGFSKLALAWRYVSILTVRRTDQ